DLLAVARLERREGAIETELEPTDLGALVAEAAAEFSGRAAAAGVRFETRVDAGLAAPLDRGLARRLLDNLIANALDFVKRGDRVELSARRDGGQLALAVRNDGPPVAPEVRAHLFERIAPGRARSARNAGLGLYFCRLVAEAHRGRIALEDDPAWPVSFVARLPL
ncbi:MAG TPA: HAMP domain-containing sensor histidine kinase, partial [Planctomycetota bacterium]|nr:HAMP domain-containing sensor histidine kinase [Planctomycetota bacterium]